MKTVNQDVSGQLEYKGFAFVSHSGVHKCRVVRGGSQVLLAAKRTMRRVFCLLAMKVYDTRPEISLEIVTGDGRVRSVPSIFVIPEFPFVTPRYNRRSYKRFFLYLGFPIALGDLRLRALSRRDGSSFEIMRLSKPVERDGYNTALDIADALENAILTNREWSDDECLELDFAIGNLPPNDHDSVRRELTLILYHSCLKNHGRAWRAFKSLSSDGQRPHRYDALRARIDAFNRPLTLGRHGYNPSLESIDLATIESELSALFDDVEAAGGEAFLNSGTLLGYVRDGRPITHDDDFDIGALVPGNSQEEAAQNWRDFARALAARRPIGDRMRYLRVFLSDGVPVDIFPAWTADGAAFVYPYCHADLPETALKPLRTFQTERGVTFAVPAEPEDILTVNYGPEWRIPQPFWRFDWERSRKRFASFLKRIKTM